MANITAQDKKDMLLACYPIGSYYQSNTNTSPSTFIGGTWTQITNRFLLPSSSAGAQTTSSSRSLNSSILANHRHSYTHSHSGYSHSHNVTGSSHYHSISAHSHTGSLASHTHDFSNGNWPEIATVCQSNSGSSMFIMSLTCFADNYYTSDQESKQDYPAQNANITTGGVLGSISTAAADGGSNTGGTTPSCSTAYPSTGGAGSGSSFDIMPLWRGCYIWRRDA